MPGHANEPVAKRWNPAKYSSVFCLSSFKVDSERLLYIKHTGIALKGIDKNSRGATVLYKPTTGEKGRLQQLHSQTDQTANCHIRTQTSGPYRVKNIPSKTEGNEKEHPHIKQTHKTRGYPNWTLIKPGKKQQKVTKAPSSAKQSNRRR